MGFMDKVKDAAKNADEKLGNAIDTEKIDSKIREQEREIEKITKEIGEKVVGFLNDGKDVVMDEVNGLYKKIEEAKEKIESLKAEKEAIKNKGKEE